MRRTIFFGLTFVTLMMASVLLAYVPQTAGEASDNSACVDMGVIEMTVTLDDGTVFVVDGWDTDAVDSLPKHNDIASIEMQCIETSSFIFGVDPDSAELTIGNPEFTSIRDTVTPAKGGLKEGQHMAIPYVTVSNPHHTVIQLHRPVKDDYNNIVGHNVITWQVSGQSAISYL